MASESLHISNNQMACFSGETINICVGNDSFTIHENLIKESSPFLCSLLRRKKPGDTYVLNIPEEYNTAVQFYANWVYRRVIPSAAGSELELRKESMTLAKAYVVGKRFEDSGFQNAVVDRVIERAKGTFDKKQILPDAEAIQFTYQNVKKCSKFKVLLVDLYASHAISGYFCKPASSKYPKLFLIEVLSAVADMQFTGRMSPTNGSKKNACERYHHHSSDAACC
ncbi:hypothetical protein MaudCBS49596_003399 [Microsporum audouinii]